MTHDNSGGELKLEDEQDSDRLHQHDANWYELRLPGRPLCQDELFEGVDSETPSEDSSDGGEPGVIPTVNNSLVDEPG